MTREEKRKERLSKMTMTEKRRRGLLTEEEKNNWRMTQEEVDQALKDTERITVGMVLLFVTILLIAKYFPLW